jgi:hypothetical protein
MDLCTEALSVGSKTYTIDKNPKVVQALLWVLVLAPVDRASSLSVLGFHEWPRDFIITFCYCWSLALQLLWTSLLVAQHMVALLLYTNTSIFIFGFPSMNPWMSVCKCAWGEESEGSSVLWTQMQTTLKIGALCRAEPCLMPGPWVHICQMKLHLRFP